MFRVLTDRRVLLSIVVIGGLLGVAFWPRTIVVELAPVSRGPLVVTVDEEGRTRVHDRFVIAAPVTGRVLRIDLDPGDRVARGDVVARLLPEAPALLDARTRAEAAAALASAEASLGRARAEERRALTALSQVQHELTRTRQLTEAGATAAQALDMREADVKLAEEAARAAAFAVRIASAEMERARARITTSAPRSGAGTVVVRAPIDGVVLHRLRESESVVRAGEPLVEIGDPQQLEVVTDLLSTDAVRVKPGARATVEQWGGESVLAARVRRVEPSGFTKVSALGVEEQRVNVILELDETAEDCAPLGDGYRVEARIVLWEASDVVKVPTNALFRHGSRWAVYVAREGRARRTSVQIGRQMSQESQVMSGLSEGDVVIVHPGDLVYDGVRVESGQ